MFSLKKHEWKNWSHSVHCYVDRFFEPESVEEVIRIVKTHMRLGKRLRVVGAGHSFTPLVATSESLLSLNNLSGVERINEETRIARVRAGTKLKDLGILLNRAGYAMENLGDINEQTIAGAISTGTHGTGKDFGSLSTQVAGISIVTGTGEYITINEKENAHLLEAVKTSLGLLGVIVSVNLNVLPAYQLIETSYKLSFKSCIEKLDQLNEENRNMEFFWFPYTETVQVKTNNLYFGQIKRPYQGHFFNDIVIENGLLKVMSELSRTIKMTAKYMSKLSATGVPTGKKIGQSHHVYQSIRSVKFQEMEYSLPAHLMKNALLAMKEKIKAERYAVNFPIECRYVKGDHIWLSPAYQQDSAFIAIHMYQGMPFERFFHDMEVILQSFGGRPHWGKMHTMTYEALETIYPQLKDFLKVRAQLDPHNIFVNDYMRRLFAL